MMLSLGSAETCLSADQSTLCPFSAEETASLSTLLENQLDGESADVLAEAAHVDASLSPSNEEKLLTEDAEASVANAEGSFAMERGSAGHAAAQTLSRAYWSATSSTKSILQVTRWVVA